MNDKSILKKKILYRSKHRGTKEMDLLLGNFVNKYIDTFNNEELLELNTFLNHDDDVIDKWYKDENFNNKKIPSNNVSKKLKKFKL